MLLFVIPLRHPQTTSHWDLVARQLESTARSVCAQHGDAWRAVLVADENARLPRLPSRMEVLRVAIPVPTMPTYVIPGLDPTERRHSIRMDKVLRILHALIHAGGSGITHAMNVDADDFVSNRLAEFAAARRGEPGWYVRSGYVHQRGSRWMYRHPEFHELCGTSFLVRLDLLRLPASPEEADADYIRLRLGSHKFIRRMLEDEGTPLAPLPFPGAIYRVGAETSVSASHGIRRSYFSRSVLRHGPAEYVRRLGRLRPVTGAVRAEFGLP